MGVLLCGKSSVTPFAHCEAELPGTTFAPPAEKHTSSTATTAAAQETHRPILNAAYQNIVVL